MGNCVCSDISQADASVPVATGESASQTSVSSSSASASVSVSASTDQKTLKDATYENTPEFTFEGLRSTVKVVRVLDGDTVDIALEQPDTGKLYRHRVRLYGIDTPEKRPSKSDPLRHLEIEASYRAKEALEKRLRENDYLVLAVFSHMDKYGRLLCTLYDKTGEDLNQWMIQRGYATEYFGKTKKKFQASASPQAVQNPQAVPESNRL